MQLKEKWLDRVRAATITGVHEVPEVRATVIPPAINTPELEKSPLEIWAINEVQSIINRIRVKIGLRAVAISVNRVHLLGGLPNDSRLPTVDRVGARLGGFCDSMHVYLIRRLEPELMLFNLAHEMVHVNSFFACTFVGNERKNERYGLMLNPDIDDPRCCGVGLNEGATEVIAEVVRKSLDRHYPVSNAPTAHPENIECYPEMVVLTQGVLAELGRRSGNSSGGLKRILARAMLGGDNELFGLLKTHFGDEALGQIMDVTAHHETAEKALAWLRRRGFI